MTSASQDTAGALTAPAASPAERGAQRFLVLGTAGLRLSYLATGLGSPFVGGRGFYRHLGLDLILLTAATVWSAWLFRRSLRVPRLARMSGTAVAIDVAVAVGLLWAVTWLCAPVERLSWGNWAFSYTLSAVTLAAVRLPATGAAVAAAVLTASFLSAELVYGIDSTEAANLAGNAAAIPWFAAIARASWRYLRRSAERMDEATARILRAETARAAEQARTAERTLQYRRLHDTVLSTLTTIARGGLDYRDDLVRTRCAEDAAILRGLLTRDEAPPTPFADALVRIVDRMTAVGLRVHLMCQLDGTSIPDDVADELALAVQEVLNNTREHAGVSEAWLTAVAEDGGVTVRIVDRGCGFAPGDTDRAGTGVRESLLRRLTDLGGRANVDSMPGEGTLVELRWPA